LVSSPVALAAGTDTAARFRPTADVQPGPALGVGRRGDGRGPIELWGPRPYM
jgi:hypothetical protein